MKCVVKYALALCVVFAAASAQAASKVAVYMSGQHQSDEQGQIVATALTDALAGSAEFIVTERTSEFVNTIKQENLYQFSGAVDNSQIAEVGKKFGVTFVCVAELVKLGDFFPGSEESMLTARFINVESATIVGSTYRIGVLGNEDAVFVASEKLAGDLIADFKRRGDQAKLDHAAIYTAGGSVSGLDMITQPLLINAVVRSGKYAVSERTSSFLEAMSQELGTQYSGDVDDDQLAKLGVQSGVKYVIAIKKLSPTRVNLRMIDVKTGVIVPGMSKTGVMNNIDVKSIENSVAELISSFLSTEFGTLFGELKQDNEEQARLRQQRAEDQARQEKERADEQLRQEKQRAEEEQMLLKHQEQAARRKERNAMKKPGVTFGGGGSEGAYMLSVGAAYTYPIVKNLLFAPEANLVLGTYENRWYGGEADYKFAGANIPLLLQYITSATAMIAVFAEAGVAAEYIADTEGASLLNYGPAAGIGAVLNLGSRRVYVDIGRVCAGSEYLSYMASVRVMF